MEDAARLSFGQAFVAADKRYHRSSMVVQIPDGEMMASQGACALISDSTSRNAIARQAGDLSARGFLADYYSTPEHWDVKTAATRVLRALNGWCYSQSRFVKGGGYVSSLSAMVFQGTDAHLFHMGDTLVFRLRGAEFEQISRDHVTDIGGYRYPSRALGMDANIDIDYMTLPMKQGDIFLFTTQAVRGTLLPSDYVQQIRLSADSLDGACQQLARAAAARAGERGYDGQSFCFQLVRVDRLPESGSEGPDFRFGKLPVPPELVPGEQFEGYDIEVALSPGGKARVYRVRDVDTDRRFIFKSPSPGLALDDAYLAHFMLQQWVAERVSSPFIVRSVSPARPRRHLYYLMEDVEGEPLDQWMARHPEASLEQRLDIAQQICKAVHALHRKNILHQGICPENIMLDRHEGVVLIDFGACYFMEHDDQEGARALVYDIGMNPHHSPEYALKDNVSRRSDQFALASVIYWLVSGGLPYGESLNGLAGRSELDGLSYRPLALQQPSLPPVLDDTLRRALMPQKALRYRRLSELVYGLKLARQAWHAGQELMEPPPQHVPAGRRTETRWKIVAGISLLALIISWWF
ncbi:bifunctional protein-serine/threonine kinase/phosphatase [Larsenimonas rhizosphaerae]|uniref:bifunctional protein-serine/threonine kinase/phosphatase n=1 Tax=Larsenimonas rhizosphaerae TaxID=2944682 RepID=UPI0020340628|nr:bifunctional protein-serine/threonine kinase/phosphatase [Larsenimonas rhizosphaerae]MCM2130845.1 bifunctional serine/threonine-protein phosphatase/kinase [Larsenimonas rhizosphaerae]